jgi:hypothetical protein
MNLCPLHLSVDIVRSFPEDGCVALASQFHLIPLWGSVSLLTPGCLRHWYRSELFLFVCHLRLISAILISQQNIKVDNRRRQTKHQVICLHETAAVFPVFIHRKSTLLMWWLRNWSQIEEKAVIATIPCHRESEEYHKKRILSSDYIQ